MTALRHAALWALVLMAAASTLALAVDGTLLLRSSASFGVAVAGALIASALAVCTSLVAAPGVALVAWLCRRIDGLANPVRYSWPLLVFALSLAACWRILEPSARTEYSAYRAMALVSALAISGAIWAASAKSVVWGWLVCVPLAVGGLALDLWLVSGWYPEIHGLAHLLQLVGITALLALLMPRLRAMPQSKPLIILSVLLVLSTLAIYAVDPLVPGWRWASGNQARHAPRLAAALRTMIDLDGDGYSPIAWGIDCDDWDDDRHPLARDEPGGGDANCNGVDPPAHPEEADFGLLPPVGDLGLASGGASVVLLVTVESLRADLLTEALMPELWRYSEGGVRFSRAYSGGSRTRVSLGLLHEATVEGAPRLVEKIRASGAHTTAIVPRNFRVHDHAAGFDTTIVSQDAAQTTEAALTAIKKHEDSTRPHFLWLHYYDPHRPYREHKGLPLPGDLSALPKKPAYLSEVAYTDQALGQLFAGLPVDRAVVVVTGDHGEGFGNHGVYSHGNSGYEEIVHVAAVMGAPGTPGQVHQHVVSHLDVPPTLLGALGLRVHAQEAERLGRSWLRLREAPDAALHSFVFARSSLFVSGAEGRKPLGVLVTDRHKLIASYEDQLFALYDLVEDPREIRDLAGEETSLASRLWRALAVYSDLAFYP